MTDDEPEVRHVTVRVSGSGGKTLATLTYTPFQFRLFESCRGALTRLEVQTRMRSDTFTETGEVLFWLYAISNYGSRKAKLAAGLQWARNRYAHGQLFTVPHKMSDANYDTEFVWDGSSDAEPHWKHVFEIIFDHTNAYPDPKGLQAYQDELAGQPVLATLQAEAARLLALARSHSPRSGPRLRHTLPVPRPALRTICPTAAT